MENHFKSLEQNPITFTNILMELFQDYGTPIFKLGDDIDDVINMLEDMIEIYNNHHPNSNYIDDDESNLIIEASVGDLPLLILILYLIDVKNALIPICMANLKTVYGLIQKTFNESVQEHSMSTNKINDITEIEILHLIKVLRP